MSSIRPTSLIAVAITGAAFASSAPAQAATTTLAPEQAPTRVAAWESTIMWSRQDPATGRYALMKSVAGAAPVAVAVAQSAGKPFDIDLGTSASRSTFAVYTRGGVIHQLNVATGAEKKLTKLSSLKGAERSPTIQNGRIAFIRRSGGVDELRIGTASTGSRVIVRGSIASAELGKRHVAYVTHGLDRNVGEGQMHVRNLATRFDKVVYKARSGGSNVASITRASYVAKPEGFLWARTNIGAEGGNRLVRYTLNGGRLGYAQGAAHYLSAAWAGATLGVVTSGVLGGSESADSTNPAACTETGVRYCDVEITSPLTFSAKP